MNEKIWEFPRSGHSINYGVSGSGTDQFSNEPLKNLCREIIQNSLDARIENKTARVEFHLFKTSPQEFPGGDTFLKYIMDLKKDYITRPDSDKEKRFVNDLLHSMNQKEVTWLRISDFNTSGLWGSSELNNHNTPWFAFIKSSGKTEKSEVAGGAKGLGKNAIFANSGLKTMIVSTFTRNPNNNKDEYASIGIAKLISRRLKNEDPNMPDDYTQSVGFLVDNNEFDRKYLLGSKEMLYLDPEFDREKMGYGTDIYVPAFQASGLWDESIIIEAIQSFIPAIMDKELKIIISYDETTVTKILDDSSIKQFVMRGVNYGKKEARALYELFNSSSKKVISFDSKKGFEMQLLLLQDQKDGLDCVYEYRLPTKMKIQSDRPSCGVGYTGALLIKGEELCKRLRSIEDATHSKWSILRYKETAYTKEQIQEALEIVRKFITEECEKFGASSSGDSTYIELEGWNSEEETYDMSIGTKNTEVGLPSDEMCFNTKDDTTKNPYVRKPRKRKGTEINDEGPAETEVQDEGTIGGEGGEFIHVPGKGTKIHNTFNGDKTYDPSTGEDKVITRRRILALDAKIPSVEPDDGIFDLVFTSSKSGTEVEIELLKSGAEGEVEQTIIESAVLDNKDLKIVNNKITMENIEKNRQYRIHLKVNENRNYIWEVNIYAKD